MLNPLEVGDVNKISPLNLPDRIASLLVDKFTLTE